MTVCALAAAPSMNSKLKARVKVRFIPAPFPRSGLCWAALRFRSGPGSCPGVTHQPHHLASCTSAAVVATLAGSNAVRGLSEPALKHWRRARRERLLSGRCSPALGSCLAPEAEGLSPQLLATRKVCGHTVDEEGVKRQA